MKAQTEYTEQQENEIGGRIAEIFMMRRDREYEDRWQTAWGTKTNIGLFRTFRRLAEEIESGQNVPHYEVVNKNA